MLECSGEADKGAGSGGSATVRRRIICAWANLLKRTHRHRRPHRGVVVPQTSGLGSVMKERIMRTEQRVVRGMLQFAKTAAHQVEYFLLVLRTRRARAQAQRIKPGGLLHERADGAGPPQLGMAVHRIVRHPVEQRRKIAAGSGLAARFVIGEMISHTEQPRFHIEHGFQIFRGGPGARVQLQSFARASRNRRHRRVPKSRQPCLFLPIQRGDTHENLEFRPRRRRAGRRRLRTDCSGND